MNRRKRVQVGWYCDHDHEPFGQGTHLKPEWKRGKFLSDSPSVSTRKALEFLDHNDPKKRPACPLAEPIYVYREQS